MGLSFANVVCSDKTTTLPGAQTERRGRYGERSSLRFGLADRFSSHQDGQRFGVIS
jgi:hypothetical protein